MTDERYKEICDQLNPSISSLLNLIRSYLQANQASVMVGAGFSKNADFNPGTKMKDWNELAEDFYSQLYAHAPSNGDLAFKSPIRLASQLASYASHSELDKVISNSLPDMAVSPGILHRKLMQLPWHDVFTTNYDTLLERTSKDWKQHYTIVTNRDTLIYSKSPRIIKLHGSFPNQHPFIITEEDFRTYPNDHPEFVNTVRQSLIENLFCLIGFSGEDENFLSWIGWLRDVIGKESVLCYLITYNEELHDSEIRLMVDRGIRPINLRRLPLKEGEGIKEALDFFLTYITPMDEHNIEEWSGKLDGYSYENLSNDVIERMREVRESYPGWPYLPAERLDDFKDIEQEAPFVGDKMVLLDDEQKFRFVQELLWRIQVSYSPLVPDTVINYIEELLEKHSILSLDIIDMALVLLSLYRKSGKYDKFDQLYLRLAIIKDKGTALQLHTYIYEKALYASSTFNFSILKELLSSWNVLAEDSIPSLWKSNILTFIGDINGARVLLEAAIQHVETQYRTTNSINQQMLWDVLQMSLFSVGGNIERRISTKKSLYLTYVDELRMNLLNYEKKRQPGQHVVHTFNIGRKLRSWYSGTAGLLGSYVYPYRYITMRERIGYPFSTDTYGLDVEHSKTFLMQLVKYEPEYVIGCVIRCMDSDLVKNVFTREILHSWSSEKCERFFENIHELFENPKTLFEERIRNKVLIPLLSRMCIRLEQPSINKIYEMVLAASIKMPKRYDLYREELNIIYDCANEDSKSLMLIKCLKTPIPEKNTPWDILMPKCLAQKLNIPDETILLLCNALQDSLFDSRCVLCRIQWIWNWLSDDSKQALSDAIINWRANQETSIAIQTYTYVHPTVDEMCFIVSFCRKQLDLFCDSMWHGEEVSTERDKVIDSFKNLIFLSKLLTLEQVEAIYKHLNVLIRDVYRKRIISGDFPWNNDDYYYAHFDRNLRRFVQDTIEIVQNRPIIQTLYHTIKQINSLATPLLEIEIRLQPFIAENFSRSVCKKLNSYIGAKIIETRIDGMQALCYLLHQNLNYKTSFGTMLSFMKKTQEDVLVLYLQSCFDILQNVSDKALANDCDGMMREMLNVIDIDKLSFEFKTDVCFYAGKLAGIMSMMNITKEDIIDRWKEILMDSSTDSDVKNSFEQGQLLFQQR